MRAINNINTHTFLEFKPIFVNIITGDNRYSVFSLKSLSYILRFYKGFYSDIYENEHRIPEKIKEILNDSGYERYKEERDKEKRDKELKDAIHNKAVEETTYELEKTFDDGTG